MGQCKKIFLRLYTHTHTHAHTYTRTHTLTHLFSITIMVTWSSNSCMKKFKISLYMIDTCEQLFHLYYRTNVDITHFYTH